MKTADREEKGDRYKGKEGTRGEGREERRAKKLSHLEDTFQKKH